ncbi:MAG: 3'(2'),5'-bisphosphate nucleotidase CysQ [Candidatus Glassbacteria bacterium]|nr:3'(2'),5'-bisphosphate nucleotidase CysQ [Candidatus Glassbacteria bacterium]
MSRRLEFDAELLGKILPEIIGIARGAGVKTVAFQPSAGGTVETKSDGSPVTLADRTSHEHIMDGLAKLEPGLVVISEEGDLDGVESGSCEQFWLVDPLDGTRDFLAGLDEYTVNIALVEDGNPIMGVVVAPAGGTAYFSARALGAWKQISGSPAQQISAAPSGDSLRAAISRSHSSKSTEEFLARLGATETLRSGSSIKICLVAEGAADIYPRLGPTSIWDTAAGVAVAREAGCEVTDLDGNQLGFDPADGILQQGFLVTRPELLEKALEALK